MKSNRWQIVFENEDFIVLDKPAHILSIPDRYDSDQLNLYHELIKYRGEIYVNHRLDRETSGLILFTKTAKAHKAFSVLFEERRIDKFYYALVHGEPALETGLIDLPLAPSKSKTQSMMIHDKGRQAQTKFRLIESWERYSWLELKLLTGRMHQIRLHLQAMHMPLICDAMYGDGRALYLSDFKKKFRKSKDREEKPLLERQALHAHMLRFKSPLDGEDYEFQAELPKDMKASINQFAKCLGEDHSSS